MAENNHTLPADGWTTVIRPKTGWFDIDLHELWQYRDLIVMFVKRNFTVLYKQTILGPAWIILNPLITTIIFNVVFGGMANMPTDGVPGFLFYMAGNTLWTFFANCVNNTANTFVTNSQIFGKVYFPRLTMPVSQVLTSLINFFIQAAMYLIFWIYFLATGSGIHFTLWLLAIPFVILEVMLLGLGVGIIVSSLTTKYRDLAIAVGFGVQLWMYASPVVYPLSMLESSPRLKVLVQLNPMTSPIEIFRMATLGTGTVTTFGIVYSLVFTAAALVLGVVLFTIIPLIVMILIGFTNYDRNHLPPAKLFTWVGLDNFSRLTALTADSSFGYAFTRVLAWTLVWAVLATFTCYIGGILMAMFINNRNTKGKKFWRTCFMVAMAVPQFVSLLLVRNFFADLGIVNTICKDIGLTDWLYSIGAIPTANFIPFLTHPAWARPMIILINIWVGIPYQMLIATGILMNIPTELIEAAKIDGANAWQSFKSITMPYILFITGPSLVNSLVANINNFNVIWLLSRDVYTTSDQLMANANANEVDLLVTWLYRLTQDQSNYKMASVIGILVFVVCAILTLVAFSRMIKGDKEESFQ